MKLSKKQVRKHFAVNEFILRFINCSILIDYVKLFYGRMLLLDSINSFTRLYLIIMKINFKIWRYLPHANVLETQYESFTKKIWS